jgi:hypothetical protein
MVQMDNQKNFKDLIKRPKGQCHEISDLFFHKTIPSRPLINILKYFRIMCRIRRSIRSQTFVQRYVTQRWTKFFLLGCPLVLILFGIICVRKFTYERFFDRLFLYRMCMARNFSLFAQR